MGVVKASIATGSVLLALTAFTPACSVVFGESFDHAFPRRR